MSDIVGKWVLQKGLLKGLWFEFKEDGSYYSELPRMVKIKASGSYTVRDDRLIDTEQTEHTMNLIGQFAGLYEIKGETLKLLFGPVPGGPRPDDLSKAGLYKREN